MAYTSKLPKEEEKRLAQEKVQNSFAKVQTDVLSVFNKDALPAFLRFAAKLHYFDAYNLLLVYNQRPTASFVAPYRTWEQISINHWHDPSRLILSPPQKKQGIGVLAPYILKKKLSDAMDLRSASIATKIISYLDYHVVYVFDKEQTNGIPAPVMDWELSKNKNDAEAAFQALRTVAPFEIVFALEDSNFKGNFVFKEGDEVAGRPDTLLLNAKYKHDHFTLCNLIIRSVVVHWLIKSETKYTGDELEKIVECVSFVIASYFGLLTSEYTFFFVRTWASTPEQMLEILKSICLISHSLIEEIETEMIDYKSQMGSDDDIYVLDEDIYEFENMSMF